MKIQNIKNTGKYCLVTFDNEKTIKLLLETCRLHYLEIGKNLSADEIKAIETANEFKMCINYAFDILSRRPHSEFEIKTKLKKKFWKCNISEVMNECRRLNLMDDENFTSVYIDELQRNGKGRFQIISSLKQKGIPQEIIEKYCPEAGDEDEENERALKIAEKKYKLIINQPPLKIKEKLYRFLISKGFSYETVHYAVNKILND